jgi:hypothetical protein
LPEDEETILEYVVRERLSKEHIIDLSTSLGGPRQGSRDELAERLLSIRGSKTRDALAKLSTDDLKLVVRRFDVPEAPKPATPSGFLNSILSDERSSLIKRIEEVASKQRAPRPSAPGASGPSVGTKTGAASPVQESQSDLGGTKGGAAPIPAVEASTPPPSTRVQPREADPVPSVRPHSPAPPLVGGSDAVQFEELCRFLDGYNFTKRWDSEDLYEAELGGAISGHFRGQKVVHQMAVGGTKADIVALGAVIEIKYPKTRQPLQTLVGQVEDYQRLFANRVVVVLCSGGLRETQAFNDSAATLSERGVKVYIK